MSVKKSDRGFDTEGLTFNFMEKAAAHYRGYLHTKLRNFLFPEGTHRGVIKCLGSSPPLLNQEIVIQKERLTDSGALCYNYAETTSPM